MEAITVVALVAYALGLLTAYPAARAADGQAQEALRLMRTIATQTRSEAHEATDAEEIPTHV